MQDVFGSFAYRLGKKSVIDNITFRLHYRVTFTILVCCSMLATLHQYFGSAISCMQNGVPSGLMSTFCWIHGTYTIPGQLTGTVGINMPHPGIGPTTDPNLLRKDPVTGDELRHAWYQWVCFVLFGQALLFYFPHYLWKSWEGGKISMLVKDLDTLGLEPSDTKRERRMATVNYIVRTKGSHNFYVAKYIFCEILNLANVFGQMFFMDYFLGGHFFQYGRDVLQISELPIEQRVDPMSKVFPKLTKCAFNKYGSSGTVELTDGLCLLAVNIINEKIYVFLWFWFIAVSAFTALHLILRVVSIASPRFRLAYLTKRAKANNRSDIAMVVRKCSYGDWFLLMQLSKSYDPLIFYDFIVDLRDRFNLREEVKE